MGYIKAITVTGTAIVVVPRVERNYFCSRGEMILIIGVYLRENLLPQTRNGISSTEIVCRVDNDAKCQNIIIKSLATKKANEFYNT